MRSCHPALLYYARADERTLGAEIAWNGERLQVRAAGHGPEAELACGVAVGRLTLAAGAFGLRAEVRWMPEDGIVAELEVSPGPTRDRLEALRRAGPNRSAYQSTPIAAAVLGELRAIAQAHGLQLALVTAPERVGVLVGGGPAVGLLLGPDDAHARAGACFAELACVAAGHGLAQQTFPAQRVELGAALGGHSDARPLLLFRLGAPTRPGPGRVRRPPAVPPARCDQAALRRIRVLFAGCGRGGDGPVEILAPLGLARMVLAEAGRDTAGRNHGEALGEHVADLNPDAEILVEPAGVHPGNVDWLVGTCDVVVDNLAGDRATRRLLHEEAWRQRRLVVTAHGQVVDYRDEDVRPLEYRRDAPGALLDYLAAASHRLGALVSWAVVDFAAGRPPRYRGVANTT